MNALDIFFWIDIILISLLVVFCWKVYLKNYLDSQSKLITILLITSTLISVFFCFDSLLSCHNYNIKITFVQDFYGKYECNANFIKTLINECITHVKKVTFAAYLSFLVSVICRKIIVNYNNSILLKQKNKLWDWKKIQKI